MRTTTTELSLETRVRIAAESLGFRLIAGPPQYRLSESSWYSLPDTLKPSPLFNIAVELGVVPGPQVPTRRRRKKIPLTEVVDLVRPPLATGFENRKSLQRLGDECGGLSTHQVSRAVQSLRGDGMPVRSYSHGGIWLEEP